MTFTYSVIVTAETKEQADYVMTERLAHDESYGFPYSIEWGDDPEGPGPDVIDLRNGDSR